MKNSQVALFKVYYLPQCEYSCLVICMSRSSIFEYLDQICAEFQAKKINSAKVLFDQLLIAGNKLNRFLSIEFEAGSFNLSTAKNIELVDSSYRRITSYELMKNPIVMEQSVLTERQRKMIARQMIL